MIITGKRGGAAELQGTTRFTDPFRHPVITSTRFTTLAPTNPPNNRRQTGIPDYSSRRKRDEKAFKEYQRHFEALYKILGNADR